MKYLNFSLILLGISCNAPTTHESEVQVYQPNQYIGEAACIQCHQQAYTDWKGSHHDWAMKLPNDTTVLGDFDNATFTADGENYFFFTKDSNYYVKTGKPGKEEEYKVAHTFGFEPLQQYLIKFPDGKYQVLRASWDTKNNEWFNQYAGQKIPQDDWLHWTKGGQRWNTMCAECHSTNLKKNYNLPKDAFATTYANETVSCEACHGPAGGHLNWASKEKPTGDPQIKSVGNSQVKQLNQCAGCHARRVKLTEVMKPGVAFDDQFMLQTINNQYYYTDGQIKEEDFVVGSFVQSKMFAKGVTCSDCHNVHTTKVKLRGNTLCLQCHKTSYDSKQHHFHSGTGESTKCVSCHMPTKVYMGNDVRRDHSFRVPRPDQSVTFNTPNACTSCHEDKSAQWATQWVNEKYGTQRANHFSNHLLVAANPPYNEDTKKEVLQFITNMNYPAIARATAIEYYPLHSEKAEFDMLLTALTDSAALVRYHALAKFQRYPLKKKLAVALEYMEDETKLVRIGAAQLIAELDLTKLAPVEYSKAQASRLELEEMMRANADFPLGRLQLGDYYFKQQNLQKAINEYEMALKMDSLLTPVYTNLATAYSTIGQNQLALTTLTTLLKIEPEFGRAYYLQGLLLYEMGQANKAIESLRKAIRLDSLNYRAFYNLANLYYIQGNYKQANTTIQNGLMLASGDADGIQLKKLIQAKIK